MYLTVPAFHWGLALTGGDHASPYITVYPHFFVYFVFHVVVLVMFWEHKKGHRGLLILSFEGISVRTDCDRASKALTLTVTGGAMSVLWRGSSKGINCTWCICNTISFEGISVRTDFDRASKAVTGGDRTSHSILMSVCALKGEDQMYLVYFKRSQVYLVYLMKRRIHLVVLNLLKLSSILSRRILPGRWLRKSTLKSTPSDTLILWYCTYHITIIINLISCNIASLEVE